MKPREKGKNVKLYCKDPSLTQQHFKDLVDPRMIMERYLKTGLVDPSVVRSAASANYGDTSVLPNSYEQALEVIRSAGEGFSSLPARLQEHYGNALEFVRQTSSDRGMTNLVSLLKVESAELDSADGKADKAAAVVTASAVESGAKA